MSRFKLPSGQVVQIDTPFEIDQLVIVPAVVENVDGEVVEISPASSYLDKIQHPSGVRGMSVANRTALGIIEIVEQPRPDDRYGFVGEDPATPGAWIVTPFAPERMKASLIDYAKSKRWDKEQGGLEIAGLQIATDDRSQRLVMGARMKADKDAAFTTRWSTPDGGVTLNATMIIAVSDAVLDHVNGVFLTYDTLEIGINNGTITTFEAIDAAFAA